MLSALRALAPTTAAPTLGLSHQDFAWYWCTTPPNESRVSRAAWRMKSSFLDHTPRRLQALVRQRLVTCTPVLAVAWRELLALSRRRQCTVWTSNRGRPQQSIRLR